MHDQPLSHILTRIPGGRMAKHKALEHSGEFMACHMGTALAKSSNFINSVWKDTDKEKPNSNEPRTRQEGKTSLPPRKSMLVSLLLKTNSSTYLVDME